MQNRKTLEKLNKGIVGFLKRSTKLIKKKERGY